MNWIEFCNRLKDSDLDVIDAEEMAAEVTGFHWKCDHAGCNNEFFHVESIRTGQERNPQFLAVLCEQVTGLLEKIKRKCQH